MINAIQLGAIDRVLVWSIDRIGKSLVELVGFMETCRLHDVSLWVEGPTQYGHLERNVTVRPVHDDGNAFEAVTSESDFKGAGCGSRSVYQIWEAAAYQTEGGESETRTGCRQGRATGRPNGGDFPCVGVEDQDVD